MEVKKEIQKVQKLKSANFIRMNIEVNESPMATFWVGIFTMLPFPIILIKMFSGLAANLIRQYTDFDITQKELLQLLNSMNGLIVDVETNDANIQIEVY